MKRLQNKISESGLLLPVMMAYGLLVWFAAGLLSHNWWPQLVCLALSVYMMVELSNTFSLLRVRSRMTSGTFIALTCTMPFLFGSMSGALVQLFTIASLLFLLSTYQSPQSLGRIFYAFLFQGLASLLWSQQLLFAPLLWLLMATQLQSLTWRGVLASLIGLLAPYWFVSVWFVYQRDFSPLADHFSSLIDFAPLSGTLSTLSLGHYLAFALIACLTVTGIVHFWRNSIDEKIRTRLLYGLFTWMSLVCLLLTALQPQHYDPLMRIALIYSSPLLAHFLALGSSRITNYAFFAILFFTVAVTVVNIVAV